MTSLVYLSARADPRSPGLSQAQLDFLHAVSRPGLRVLRAGWPFVSDTPMEGQVSLASASWRSFRAWRHAHTLSSKTRAALARLDPGSVIITGSCGLDLLVAGWRSHFSFKVVALGPVCRQHDLPVANLTTVVGRKDLLSRALFRGAVDLWVGCGHMGYLDCAQTREFVREEIRA